MGVRLDAARRLEAVIATLLMMTVLVLGDSHAAGHPGKELAMALRREGHTVEVRGEVGLTARALSRRRVTTGYDMVVMVLGTNDLPSRGLRRAYGRLRGSYPASVIIGPPSFRSRRLMRTMVRVIGIQWSSFDGCHVDSRPATEDILYFHQGRARDGVHFNRRGAQRWVMRVLPDLLERMEACK